MPKFESGHGSVTKQHSVQFHGVLLLPRLWKRALDRVNRSGWGRPVVCLMPGHVSKHQDPHMRFPLIHR